MKERILNRPVSTGNYSKKVMHCSSFIICTKDRPDDLTTCVKSIIRQTILPGELVIVDSGKSVGLEKNIKELISETPIKLKYIYSQPGVNRQRNIGVKEAAGEIVFFFDDDVILEPDYHEKALEAYEEKKGDNIYGLQGTITNISPADFITRIIQRIFLLRRNIYQGKNKMLASGFHINVIKPQQIIPVEVFHGIMSFRKEVFHYFQFDEFLSARGYAMADDKDFSYRVSRKFNLFQTPYARLVHLPSKVSRPNKKEIEEQRILNNYYLFKKNMPQTLKNRLCFYWALLGLVILSFYRSINLKDLSPVWGTLRGLFKMMNYNPNNLKELTDG
jgi:glycosyltransferase involved in cell wall biosynthesis